MNCAVIGSNRGIGIELTRELKRQGNKVFAFCRKAGVDLLDIGVDQIIEGFDVSIPEAIHKGVLATPSQIKFDQVWHCPGIYSRSILEKIDYEDMLRAFEVNSLGTLLTAKAMSGKMSHDSRLIVLTSQMGSVELNIKGESYSYRMSKSAQNMICKNLAIELAPLGIDVFPVHPGFVKTQMNDYRGSISAQESAEKMIKLFSQNESLKTGSFYDYNGKVLPW